MKQSIYGVLLLILSLVGCDYLNMVPEDDIETVETIFEQRSQAETWLKGIYSKVGKLVTDLGDNVSYIGADEFVACEYLRNLGAYGKYSFPGFKISDGLQMSQQPYGNVWDQGGEYDNQLSFYENIRYCNVFLENIDRVYNMELHEKRQWAGEMRALKAYLYFELIRRYGPIVLVPDNIGVDEPIEVMQQQRQHVDTCFKAVVDLLDQAYEELLPRSATSYDRSAFFCRESVLALKARVLVYAASPLFNGNEFYSDFKGKNGESLFSITKDDNKWRIAAEACDAAVNECESGGFSLISGLSGRGSELLDQMYTLERSVLSDFDNNEAILEWKDQSNFKYYNLCLPRINQTGFFNESVYGSLAPSMKMVEMYYTENGLPIDMDNSWDYTGRYKMSREASDLYNGVVVLNEDILQLHLRREPRFYANIAADRTMWQLGPIGSSVNYNFEVKAHRNETFGTQLGIVSTTVWQNPNGYWLKKFINSNLTTVNYNVSQNKTVPLIRLAELYLLQAEAWNEYLDIPDNEHVYVPLNKVRERAGIMDVVTAWKSYSKQPGKVDTKEGMRDIIRQETNIELAFEGHRFWNLRRWKIAHEELNQKQYGWNILGETAQAFYNNFEGPVVVWSKNKFTAPRDYLFPIKAEEILISSVVQNPNW